MWQLFYPAGWNICHDYSNDFSQLRTLRRVAVPEGWDSFAVRSDIDVPFSGLGTRLALMGR
jgi:hypothetical protein